MNRDWQKDMAQLTLEKARWRNMKISTKELDIGMHWLQQYAEWKAKAYELEVRNYEMIKVLERVKADIDEFRNYIDVEACETVEDQAKAFNELLKTEKERADRAEAELAKLKDDSEMWEWLNSNHCSRCGIVTIPDDEI